MKTATPFCAAVFLLAACATARSPAALLRDKESGELTRIRAVAEMPAGDAKELWRLVFDGSDAMSVRAPAARRLLDADAAGFWKRIERDYMAVNDGPMLRWVCEAAIEDRQVRDSRRAVVLLNGQLRLGMAESDRPEPRALGVIAEKFGDDGLVSIVCGRRMEGDERAQKAAWFGLARNWGVCDPKLAAVAATIPPETALAPLLKARLASWPLVDEEIEILRTQSALPQLKNQTPVAPRGLPLARRNLLAASFTPLSPPVVRTQDPPLNAKGTPSATDTAVCAEILRGLRTPAVAAALFKEADRDLDDTRSEHGGLLYWNDKNEVVFDAIPPLVKRHNERYDPPEKLFERLRDGLAHVHFHAQARDNGRYAGPGRGDMAFVENNRVNAVVFTFVDRDTLNADAYFPGGVVMDLGCVRRAK